MTAGPLSRLEGLGPIGSVVRFGRDWFARFIHVQGFDRAMAIAAYGYSALIPLLIVYASVLPSDRSFADSIIERFDLTGASADTVRQAFASNDMVNSSVTVLGVLLLLVSALSFARGHAAPLRAGLRPADPRSAQHEVGSRLARRDLRDRRRAAGDPGRASAACWTRSARSCSPARCGS